MVQMKGSVAATTLLDELDLCAEALTREEQIELARRLLDRAAPTTQKKYSILDWVGAGKGTWKTAEEVRQYIEEERNSWER